MKKIKKYFFLYTIILGYNITYSQVDENITKQDYYVYVSNLCGRIIQNFGSSKNQTVVKISATGDRKYLVTYMDNFTQKMIVGPFDCNPYNVVSFEKFKVEELDRRKTREKQRLEDIEYERKKEEERKRQIRENKIREEKKRINKVRTDIFSKSYGGSSNEFKYYFFYDGHEPFCCENYYESNLVIEFSPNEEFIKRDVILKDEIEEIGKLRVSIKEDPNFTVFEMIFGVKNLHDDSKIRYYVDGLESKFDFGLKGKRVDNMHYKPLNHLINFYSDKGRVYKEFSDKFKLPFNLSINEFNDLDEFSLFYTTLKYLNKIKYTGEYKELVNYTIIKNLPYDERDLRVNRGKETSFYDRSSIEVIKIENKKKTFSWVLIGGYYDKIIAKYTLNKKSGYLSRQREGSPSPAGININPKWTSKYTVLNPDELNGISNGNYKYSSLMNSN
jgi:hypothetical protein